jgi:hypothetical protein
MACACSGGANGRWPRSGSCRGKGAAPGRPRGATGNKQRDILVPLRRRLPDPQWLQHWLDAQIGFDAAWEKKVIAMILLNLSRLFDRPIATLQDLSRLRRELAAEPS